MCIHTHVYVDAVNTTRIFVCPKRHHADFSVIPADANAHMDDGLLLSNSETQRSAVISTAGTAVVPCMHT